MAVTPKEATFRDRSGRLIEVRYVTLTKGNKKGVTTLVDGKLHNFFAEPTVSFLTKVNGKNVVRVAAKGNMLFQTGKSKRWQLATKEQFSKRFAIV